MKHFEDAMKQIIPLGYEKALAVAWVNLARREGNMKVLPRIEDKQITSKVVIRRNRICTLLREKPGLLRDEINEAIPGCNGNDFANLRMSDRIHARYHKPDWLYFAGPSPEPTFKTRRAA